MPHALIIAVYLTLFTASRADISVDPDEFRSGLTDPTSDLGGAIDIEGLLLGIHSGSSSLFARQRYVCPDPAGQSCSATKCCRSGESCMTVEGVQGCCPNTSETCGGTACAATGSTCCGTYVCDPGRKCNTLNGYRGCCPNQYLNCPDACCPAGSTCAATAGYCSRIRTSTSTRSSTSTSIRVSTSTSTSASTSASVSTRFRTSSTISGSCAIPTKSTTRQRDIAWDTMKFDSQLTTRARRKRPCNYEVHSSGQNLPTLVFRSNNGQLDDLIQSMCAGMQGLYDREQRGIRDPEGFPTDFEGGNSVLTYAGSDKKHPDNPINECNRKAVKCREFCKDAKKKTGDQTLECDEFPFASTFEGGALATRVCVPAKQNSKTQGRMISRLIASCGLQRGDKFAVRIEGGCKDVPAPIDWLLNPPPKRAIELNKRETVTEPTSIEDAGAELNDPLGDGSLTFVALGLDELKQGRYDISVRFNGTAEELSVVDYTGEELYVIDAPTSPVNISFAFEDDFYAPAALFVDTEQILEVTYTGTIQPIHSSPTASPTPTRSGGSKLMNHWSNFAVLSSILVSLWACI